MLRRILICIILLIPLMVLFPGFTYFLYPAGSSFSDLTISHYPNLIFLKESLLESKSIPLWSNAILSGYPFMANPLSGLYYPFTWVLLFLPQPFGFNFIVILHLFFGGMGVFCLLRLLKKEFYPALIGAVIFELMPKMFAHYASGHITLLYAVSITPWLFYAEQRRREDPARIWKILPGILLGLLTLADVRWLPYGLLTWGLFSLHLDLRDMPLKGKLLDSIKSISKQILSLLSYFLVQGAIAIAISAPLLLTLIEYTNLSTRSLLDVSDRLFLSLSPIQLIGLIFPDMAAYSEWVLYPGALSILAVLVVIFNRKLRKEAFIWICILAIGFFLAFGSNNPLMPFLSNLPGLSYLRVPTRALFLAGFALSVLVGIVLDEIERALEKMQLHLLPVFACCVLVVGLFIGQWRISGLFSFEFFWGALFFLLFTVFLFLLNYVAFLPRKPILIMLLLLSLLELGVTDYSQFQTRTVESVMSEGHEIATHLAKYDGVFRIYSPSYSIPQLTAAQYGLELADGIDPMQLKKYASFMRKATGVAGEDYSVTLPAFKTGTPKSDNQDAVPDSTLLGYLNIRFVCAEFEIHDVDLKLIDNIGGTLVYENQKFRPRAWIQTSNTLQEEKYYPVSLLVQKPNLVQLSADGSGMVVLSEIFYPGWFVEVDGERAEILEVGGLLRGVKIGSGTHAIAFKFFPLTHYVGIIMAIAAWVLLCLYFRSNNSRKMN